MLVKYLKCRYLSVTYIYMCVYVCIKLDISHNCKTYQYLDAQYLRLQQTGNQKSDQVFMFIPSCLTYH